MSVIDGIIRDTGANDGVAIADVQRLVPVILQRTNTRTGAVERRSSGTAGLLCGASVGETVAASDGEGTWTVVSRIEINSMAKYKPVRNAKIQQLTDADFISSKYGFGDSIPMIQSNDKNANAPWTYYKVRRNVDYSRLTDFLNYDHLAACPFAFDVSGALANGIGIWFYVDNMAPTATGNVGKHWLEETCLSIGDFLAARAQNNAHLCFCIHDMDQAGNALVVTEIQPQYLSSSVEYFTIYPQGRSDDEPAVNFLNDRLRSGHTFRFIAGLVNYGPQYPHKYDVFEDSPGRDVYSMAFQEGVDRRDLKLYVNDTIAGLTVTLSATKTIIRDYGEVEVDGYGMTMHKYDIQFSVTGTFVTPPGHWAVQEVGVIITLKSDHGYVGDNYAVKYQKVPVQVPLNNTTYSNMPILTNRTISVYFFHGVPVSEFDIRFLGEIEWIYEHKETNDVVLSIV